MTLKVLAMQAAGGDPTITYSALDIRALLDAVLSEGVVGGAAFKVSQRAAGANFSVDIATGFAAVLGDDVANQGKYLVQSTAVENRVIPSPPGSGTRVHRVIAQVKDKLHNGAFSTYEAILDVLPDTGSGTPATPASAISLATVSVAAAQASVTDTNIASTRPYAAAPPGGVLVAATATDLPGAPFDGQDVWQRDVLQRKLWDGSAATYRTIPFGAWTSYTPSLTASTTNPTLGTASVRNGSYQQIGKRVHVNANIVFGTSGAAAGSGTYRVSLPVTAKTLTGGYHIGSAFGNDSSANDGVDGICRVGAAGGYSVVEFMMLDQLVTNAVPWTWANGDTISFSICYEAA